MMKIFGVPDDLKLKSSTTLFVSVPDTNPVFGMVLDQFFKGSKDHRTLVILEGGSLPLDKTPINQLLKKPSDQDVKELLYNQLKIF